MTKPSWSHTKRMRVSCGELISQRYYSTLTTNAVAMTIPLEAQTPRHIQRGDVKMLCRQNPLIQSVDTLHIMDGPDIQPDFCTYASLLQRCLDRKALPEGKIVHAHIIQTGFKPDVSLGNKLVSIYAKCGSLADARRVLDEMPERNAVSWTTMVAAYTRTGQGEQALALFYKMQQTGIRPDQFTFASVLPACANLAALKHGKEVHEHIIRSGFYSNVFVASALVDMYVKCGEIQDAFNVFDKMAERNVVSWTAMISGYAQSGHFEEALKLFGEMQLTGVRPDPGTFTSVLPACANLAALQHGKKVHSDVIRNGFHSDIFVGSALIDMYAKCGSLEDGRRMFDKMPRQDVVSWTAIIAGYAMHGHGKEALQFFEQMQHFGIRPNRITLIGVLSACCHAGLVDDGWRYFDRMSQDYHITPTLEHYCCMVDLLGRAGCLDEAEDFIKKMPMQPNVAVWRSLLGACRIHNNVEIGERVADCLFELDPQNAGHYVLLSNTYAAAGRWDGIEKVRKLMKDRKIKKSPGYSLVEVNNKLHGFLVGDSSHPQMQEIYATLDKLSGQMKEKGYLPDTEFVLHDVEEEQKQHILSYHSEKLAIAFGLMNLSPGTPIRIVKNLRVCGDCHSAIKFISKIALRDIFVRDGNRFHHFKDGLCSCGDYW